MDKGQLLEMTGEVEDIIFRNEDNGYTVLSLSCGGDEVTAVGIMPLVNAGEALHLIGRFKSHSNYGEQFSVEAYERTMPSGAAAILKYLSSGAVKGVGPATARRLVEAFGGNTLDVMENEPERLSKIKGISPEKAKQMSAELQKVYGIRELMAQLQKYGIPPQAAVKIWKQFGARSMNVIEENPYILCTEGLALPFELADAVAAAQERPFDDTCRVRAGLQHILDHNRQNGHTCLPKDKLLEACTSFLSVTPEQAGQALEEMLTDGTLVSDICDGRDFIFTPQMHRCETYIAARMLMLLRFPAQQITNVEEEIKTIETQEHLEYAQMQRLAISEALSNGLLILTGGPGTGKTTTLNAIIKILKKNGEKVFLAAPTGRAAQRMSEVTGCEAKTLHRLLEVMWDSHDRPVFQRNEKNLLNCDALIIDELSMVDSQLFDSVMRALPMSCRLILVGDCDQLPSVGAGNVLSDLIGSGIMPVIQLTEIFRQSMKSLIVTNAHSIVRGEMPVLSRKDSDFFFLRCMGRSTIANTIVELCKTRLPNTYGYSPLSDIQVLSPGRKGALGSNELNQKLQAALNPPSPQKRELNINGLTLREGDKVMQAKNNYDILWSRENGENGEGVFNGDVGVLLEISKSAQTFKVKFDDKTAVYDTDSALDLELAYAATVHKSQGNEFCAVIIPMYQGPAQLYYRNLLYTAVTRAKKLLILVGNEATVERMVQNNRRTLRYSGLKYFLLQN